MQFRQNLSALLLFSITSSIALFTPDKFLDTFRVDSPVTGVGGCARDAPNGQYMLFYVVEATGDAFDTAAIVQQQLGAYNVNSPSSRRLRGLPFLFFGITFEDGYQITPNRVGTYNYVKSARVSLRHLHKESTGFLICKAGVFDNINALLVAQSNSRHYVPRSSLS